MQISELELSTNIKWFSGIRGQRIYKKSFDAKRDNIKIEFIPDMKAFQITDDKNKICTSINNAVFWKMREDEDTKQESSAKDVSAKERVSKRSKRKNTKLSCSE